MDALAPAAGETCLDCEAVAVVRAACCGRLCCEEHRLARTCFLCEGELVQQHNTWLLARVGIGVLGWVAGLAPYVVLREPWTLVAIVPCLVLAVFAEAKLHRRARRHLLERRARSHGWTRPPTMPVPAAGRATLMDGIEDNKGYRAIRAFSRFGRWF